MHLLAHPPEGRSEAMLCQYVEKPLTDYFDLKGLSAFGKAGMSIEPLPSSPWRFNIARCGSEKARTMP